MALVVADRVKETTTSTGTGAIALAGAEPNFRTFSSVLSDADTTYYAIIDDTNLAFEVGLGTYASSGNTITRTTVLASSNSNNAVNFSAGTKDVFLTYPADKSVNRDASGNVSVSGGVTATSFTGPVTATQVDLTAQGDLRLQDASGGQYVALQAPATVGSSFTFTLPSADGSASQLLQTDGSGNLSFTTINASPSFTATASGAIANGDPVILNSAGTVSSVAGRAEATGSNAVFESSGIEGAAYQLASAYDSSNDKTVIVYRGPSDYIWAVVATISGTSVTFGTAVALTSANSYYVDIAFDSSNNKVVVFYTNSTGYVARARVGTVSGTSISFGTELEINSTSTQYPSLTFDSNSNKVVLSYYNGTDGKGYSTVGTVSGTTISFGTPVEFNATEVASLTSVFDSTNNKVVLCYKDQGSSGVTESVVGTVSGTSISFGTVVTATSDTYINSDGSRAVFDPSTGKVFWAYVRSNGTFQGVVGTVSGTSISFGSVTEIDGSGTAAAASVGVSFDTGANKVGISYGDGGDSNKLTFIPATVSGTGFSLGSPVILDSGTNSAQSASTSSFDPDTGAVLVSYRDGSNSSRGTSIAHKISFSNLSATNFVGFSDAAYSNGATATIQIIGSVDDAQSSLSAGTNYFITNLGTVATTGSVYAGKALSSTELAVQLPTKVDGYTFIQKYEPGGATDIIDIEAFDTDNFSAYMILLDNLIHASGNGDFRVYYKVDGSYRTDSKYSRRLIRTDQQGTGISSSDNSVSTQNKIDLGNEAEFTGLMHVFFTISSNALHDNTLLTYDFNGQRNSGGENSFYQGSATYYNSSLTSNRLQGLRIDGSSNLSGTVALYGINKG
jgi:hypothetical protein